MFLGMNILSLFLLMCYPYFSFKDVGWGDFEKSHMKTIIQRCKDPCDEMSINGKSFNFNRIA